MLHFSADAQGSQSVFQIDPDTAEVRLVGAIRPTKVSIVVQVGLTFNVATRFERQTAISQSARADEPHLSFDRQFYQTVQNRFLSVNSVSPGEGLSLIHI